VSKELKFLIKCCTEEGKKINKFFYNKKFNKNFNLDSFIEKNLIKRLKKFDKNIKVLGEETQRKKITKEKFWIIDPIDGTTNFKRRIAHFAISIALSVNNQILIGVVYDPIKNDLFFSQKNKGSYRNYRKIYCSKNKNIIKSLFATGKKSELKTFLNTRNSGSASLDLCYLASGSYEGYFHNDLYLWDIAAGSLIADEAGCKIKIKNFHNTNKVKILASNSHLFTKLEKLIKFKF
jgi:myo-inositol-1(or 4)-monophosphatase